MRKRYIGSKDSQSFSKINDQEQLKKSLFPFLLAICQIIIIILGLLFLFITYFVITRLGLGTPFPVDIQFKNSKALLSKSVLEKIALLPMPAGNLAVSRSGDVYFNFHPEYNPKVIKIAKLINLTSWEPYPNIDFQQHLITCLSIRIDSKDRLWLLDFARHGTARSPKLYSFDLLKNGNYNEGGYPSNMIIQYNFPSSVAGFGSMLNDFQIDSEAKYIYIADTSIIGFQPALIVYSIIDNTSYRILNSHSTLFGASYFLNVDKSLLKFGPFGLTINVDTIALDRSGTYLYYGAVTSNKLYRLSIKSIIDYISSESSSEKSMIPELILTKKPATDGASTDLQGKIWLTSIEDSAIVIANPNDKNSRFHITKLVESQDLLRWPDGLSFGPDGIYITVSALHLHFSGVNVLEDKHTPHYILRINQMNLKSVFGTDYELPPAGQ